MNNIFVEFLPPWVETGIQPAFYDKESGTVLRQTARMYARVNMLIRMFNKLSKETKETVEEYISKFNELYAYVHDYFDNLDVQEEINNKLDQMVEDGTLQEIITTYIQSNVTWTFDTVADMKSSTNLIAGSYAKTLGFHTLNDGGGATYFITDTGTADETSVIAVGELYANLAKENELNVCQFGAYGDGTHDDTTALNTAVEYAYLNKICLFIPEGTYIVSNPINIYGYNNAEGSLIIKGSGRNYKTIIKASSSIENVISILPYGENTYAGNVFLSDITIDGNNVAINGIEIFGDDFANSKLENINITKCSNAGITNINILTNIYLDSFIKIRVSNCATGIELEKGTNTSMRFADCYVHGCTNGYRLKGRYSLLENCCADGITGTVYYFYYFSGTMLNPGSEAPNATKVIDAVRGSISILNPFFYGNMTNASAIHVNLGNFTHVKFIGGKILIDPDTTDSNGTAEGKLYELGTNDSTIEFDGTEYSAYKTAPTAHEITSPITSNNFYGAVTTRNNGQISYIGRDTERTGGLIDDKLVGGNLPANAIYFGLSDQYRYNINGTDYRYKRHTSQGDILLTRQPADVGGIGWIQAADMTAEGASQYWTGGTYMKIPVIHSGTTVNRPTASLVVGQMYYDTTLNKPIWFKGNSTWVDATGTTV